MIGTLGAELHCVHNAVREIRAVTVDRHAPIARVLRDWSTDPYVQVVNVWGKSYAQSLIGTAFTTQLVK